MVDYPVHQPNRVAAIKDGWENQWWIATRVEDVGDEELRRRVKAARGLRPIPSASTTEPPISSPPALDARRMEQGWRTLCATVGNSDREPGF